MEEDIRNTSDIALELARLHVLRGIEFTRQLKSITQRTEFLLVKDETNIFSAVSELDNDYPTLLNAAQRAVSHGYRVCTLDDKNFIATFTRLYNK